MRTLAFAGVPIDRGTRFIAKGKPDMRLQAIEHPLRAHIIHIRTSRIRLWCSHALITAHDSTNMRTFEGKDEGGDSGLLRAGEAERALLAAHHQHNVQRQNTRSNGINQRLVWVNTWMSMFSMRIMHDATESIGEALTR